MMNSVWPLLLEAHANPKPNIVVSMWEGSNEKGFLNSDQFGWIISCSSCFLARLLGEHSGLHVSPLCYFHSSVHRTSLSKCLCIWFNCFVLVFPRAVPPLTQLYLFTRTFQRVVGDCSAHTGPRRRRKCDSVTSPGVNLCSSLFVCVCSMCGARARTAFPSYSWPRTTSPPAGRRLCWRCWRRSSRPSGLWGNERVTLTLFFLTWIKILLVAF